MDETSTAIPYDETIIRALMGPSAFLLKDKGFYSGYTIGYINES